MNNRSVILIYATLTILVLAPIASSSSILSLSATSTDRFVIQGNDGFCSGTIVVSNCGSADGSAEKPYVIKGKTFDAGSKPALELRGTTAHVIIVDNKFTGASSPIVLLSNVVNAVIRENSFTNAGRIALELRGSDVDLTRNSFALVGVGIVARDSVFSSTEDVFRQVGSGIRMHNSEAVVTAMLLEDNYPCEPGDPCHDPDGEGTVGFALRDAKATIIGSDVSLFRTAFYVYNGTLEVVETNVHHSVNGFRVASGEVTITDSNLYNLTLGVEQREGTVDARHVWWGSSSGPSGDGPGSGVPISGDILYEPWKTSRVSTPLRHPTSG